MAARRGLIIALLVHFVYVPREVFSKEDDKRILLSDDSYVHSLLTDMQDMKASLAELTTKLSQQEIQIAVQNASLATKMATGSTYIRWGKKECPSNRTSLVYSGFSGGSYYSSSGPADFLCMPSVPIYEPNAKTEGNAYVYGVEYESSIYGSARVNDDMPCSLCQTSRSNVIMLPGRNECFDGWTLEYHGWLAGGSYNQGSSQYICLDMHPEALQHSVNDENGRLLYLVKSVCGSLPCPPYEDSKTLSCAVCSI